MKVTFRNTFSGCTLVLVLPRDEKQADIIKARIGRTWVQA